MFDIESYITSILLSYVNKYINNFKSEDSQVSLWGGDASFHNLELNLQVLEQELQLPFSFVSGSIRELLIHVPWTKLASEPITVTINTIECILNLKGKDSGSRADTSSRAKEKPNSGKEVDPLHGYVQQLINKIVGNITINCNNVILKYAEEDIVLSMNIKLLKFESANNKWEPAYTDISQAEVILRKVITVTDLTLSLDKHNVFGKIEVYQEPMLYHCSLTMRLLRRYFTATVRKASTTRIDIYCNKMEFSMTEQQVSMLMRLLMLLYALQQKQLRPEKDVAADGSFSGSTLNENFEDRETWTGWAWSYVSSVLSALWDEEYAEQMQIQKGHTMHFSFYVNNASITFKVSEANLDRTGYYSHKKMRYNPMLSLLLQGIYSETIKHGLKWFNATGGISQAILLPVGLCSCAYLEITDVHYLKMGTAAYFYKTDSLFDAEATENKGKKRHYNTSWDYHMRVLSENGHLDRTPAFSYDYLYQIELPNDSSSDILSELGSDHEFSNLSEISSLRISVGPFKLRLCSGFFHRISSLLVASSYYDYPPYYTLIPDPPLQDLLPPSEEDFDALNEFIPGRSMRIIFFAPIIELELMDHPYFQPIKGNLFRKRKKISTQIPSTSKPQIDLPKLTIECQFLDITMTYPMYINRLVHTTCQLPNPPVKLFNACFSRQAIKVMSLCSRLILSPQSHTIILTPSSLSYVCNSILKPQYWTDPNIPHIETIFESESITINGTNAKMMVIAYIIGKMIKLDSEGAVVTMQNTSILNDATKENEFPYLEFCVEGIEFKKVVTNSTVLIDMSLGSLRAFIFEPTKTSAAKDIQQVLFLSGPEPKPVYKTFKAPSASSKGSLAELPLFTATIRYPIDPEIQNRPPILLFNLQEIRICLDLLVCRWLMYTPKQFPSKRDIFDSHYYRSRSIPERSSNAQDTSRKLSTQLESVHSSSDREHSHVFQKVEQKSLEEPLDLQERIYNILKKWFDVWKGMFLYGDISQCTIYFPLVSLSAVGSQGIQEAVEAAVNKDHPPDIMVVTLPFANVRSAHRQSISKFLFILLLSDNISSPNKSSFPWTMSISDLSCYTIQYGNKLTFLKPVSLSATVAQSSKTDIASLGVCVHIDMTPIVISTSEVQIYLFASILYGLMEVSSNWFPEKSKQSPKTPDVVPPVLTKSSSTVSPTLPRENTLDSTSEKTPSTNNPITANIESENVKLTAWVQWTVTRFTIELLSNEHKTLSDEDVESLQPRLKLVVDAEDIVSSLDFQSIYLKVKSRIGSVSIQHYRRSNPSAKWRAGSFSGVVMRLREDTSSTQRHEDNSFISVTVTRANCQHTHTLWGAAQKRHKDVKKTDTVMQQLLSQHRYITEIVVNIQPIDFVISLKTLRSFYLVMVPLLQIPVREEAKSVPPNDLCTFNNQTLPLAYLECQDIRVIIPSVELAEANLIHDILIFQVQKICLSPSAVNPICRSPIRPDIYEQAANARILNIPGSEVEDRQYQLDFIGISVYTGFWSDIDSLFSQTLSKLSSLRGRSENPAVEWNNLEQGQPNVIPVLNLWPVTDKFDITVIIAPAMVYKENTIICGHSVEVNFVSDIFINLSLNQIKLLSSLLSELLLLMEPLAFDDGTTKTKIKFPYSQFAESTFNLEEIDSVEIVRDSGIDTSDIKSLRSSKIIQSITESEKNPFPKQFPHYCNAVPFGILFVTGKIGLSLYQVDDSKPLIIKKSRKKKYQKVFDEDLGYEAEEENFDDKDEYKKYMPLIYIGVKQPNIFISKQQFSGRIQISCFDVNFKMSGPEYLPVSQVPTEEDFPTSLIETRSGIPDPATGVLPAFFTLKYTKGVGKNATLDINILKPTRILCAMSKWMHLIVIKDKVLETFKGARKNLVVSLKSTAIHTDNLNVSLSVTVSKSAEKFNKYLYLKDLLKGINSVNMTCDQIIFSFKSDDGHEVNLATEKIKSQLSLMSCPEKLNFLCTLYCTTLTIVKEDFKKLLLNPWTILLDVMLFWEACYSLDNDPQIQIKADSDCLVVDISPEQINSFETVMKDIKEFTASMSLKDNISDRTTVCIQKKSIEKDQHYKDDLRAGAFQFVDASTENSDELPFPYQVMFWTSQMSAMAWRYPQPRALTKVRIFPVPYKMTLPSHDDLLVLCHLEYWSEVRNRYLPFTQFHLSESEVCHLILPETPRPIIASIWRVVITTVGEKEDCMTDVLISPRAVAACMRIDSYFNKSLIPNLTAALSLKKLEIALYNNFDRNYTTRLPKCLKDFTSDYAFPESQRFLVTTFENLTTFLSSWECDIISTEFTSSTKINVLDYAFLTEQALIEPFTSKLELDISNSVLCNFISKPIEVKMGPSTAHTLSVATQVWRQNYGMKHCEKEFIIVTRYVICNDSNIVVRFGQNKTDESILLPSRHFHLYSWWSQKCTQQLKVAIQENDWVWSQPFTIYEDGIQVIHFGKDKQKMLTTLLVTVKTLSASQKKITISGQLTVSNMLLEHLEMKLVENVSENKEAEFKNATMYIVPSKSNTPSFFISSKKKYFLRLRFYGLDSAWTGDIPLREHSNSFQPWLVKVPLQERGQFLSIWCRIVIQDFQKVKRILAMLWPLFTVRSNLPFNSKVHIETPILNVNLDSVVNGKGELQQLYCQGTIDHSHQLTFKFDKSDPTSNRYVPLNCSLVDHQTFFKKMENADIDAVLEALKTCNESKWPYFDDELKDIQWIVDERPLTHVQVRYQNSCQYSSSLLVELLPWSLTANTLGVPITLMLNGIELCRIQHNGIIAPPKLEENFNIGVCAGGTWSYSGPLQLSKSDWNKAIYMPRIIGSIPLDGSIKTPVKFDSHICMLSITSSYCNEIRLLKISSTHVLSNHVPIQLQVICFAVPDTHDVYDFPYDIEPYSFAVSPHLAKNQTGISIIQWHTLNLTETNSDYSLYIAFSVVPNMGWSCPIKVDKPFLRKAFCVHSLDHPISLVLTSQEHKGTIFLAVHNDNRPQLLFENKTGTTLYCAQSSGNGGVIKESQHFRWYCKLPEIGCTYYTMPLLNEKFPELPQNNFLEKLVLAWEPEGPLGNFDWSADISIIYDNELFIKIPYYGDIKVIIVNSACTTFVTLESVSQVEISARDIRVRLTMHEVQEKISERHSDTAPTISKVYPIKDVPQILSDTSIQGTNAYYYQQKFSDQEDPSTVRRWSDTNLTTTSSVTKSLMVTTISMKEKWKSIKCNVFVNSISFVFVTDVANEEQEFWEVASLICDNVIFSAVQSEIMKLKILISDIQVDNQLYSKDSYDFPVLLIGQDKKKVEKLSSLNIPMETLIEKCTKNNLLFIDCILETWQDHSRTERITGVRSINITINPISCYIEDTYITRLLEYFQMLMPNNLVLWPARKIPHKFHATAGCVQIPELISSQCVILAKPLTIRNINVAPLSLLLSVHSTIKLYIALDQSPLQFGKFDRKRLFTTPYRLGHNLNMHYLSGAIFQAGWVVSSSELLGSPRGLARAMGTGLRDFVSLPYRGLVAGPTAFLRGITQGSASLIKHLTAGTLQSVTKLASSVARNLDRLTLDEEHLKRTEEQRRQRPQGLAQGFMQGLTGLGISLLGAVGGIAHHPIQSVMAVGASPRSLVAGVGLGIVGMVTKPLSGAAELVALTGQGLLQGAGWNSFPEPRSCVSNKFRLSPNSVLKYNWKYAHSLSTSQFLYVIEATCITTSYRYEAVALILTLDALIVINMDEDTTQRVISVTELNTLQNNDPTILAFKLNPSLPQIKSEVEGAVEMDPVNRARVADYVRTTVGLLNLLPDNSPEHSEISISPLSSPGIEENVSQENTVLTYYVNPQNRNYFLCLLSLAKQQHLNYNFPVL